MFDPNKIEDLQFSTEKQIMDRKSARIKAVDLAIPIVAMANADGGYLAIGIEDDGTITGIDAHEKNLNELLRAPYDFCIPSVQVDLKTMDVVDAKGQPNHILRMQILPNNKVVANQAEFMLYATLKNKNWGKEDASWADTAQDRAQDRAQDETQDKSTMILDFCVKPRTKQEIMDHLGFSSRRQFNERYMKPLLEAGKLVMTIPDKPSSKNQKYVAKK